MNSLEANIRDNTSKGQLNIIRKNGDVPAIIYGGKDENQKISISKKILKTLIDKENFLSSIITLNVNSWKVKSVILTIIISCYICMVSICFCSII